MMTTDGAAVDGLAVPTETIPDTAVLQTPTGTFQVSRGMEVAGADGVAVGTLKDVRSVDILIDRPWARDVYAPFDAIAGVQGDVLVLTIPAAQVDEMGWPQPPLLPLPVE